MLGDGWEGAGIGAGAGHAEEFFEGAVDDEVGVAADGAGEVGVVGFVKAVVTGGFVGVSGTFEAFEEGDFEGGFEGLAFDFC